MSKVQAMPWWVGCAALLLTVASVKAESRVLIAENTPKQPNFFTVNFPDEIGGPQTSDIRSTRFTVLVDEETGTASILSWFQHVDPMTVGGIDTGDITIVLAGDSHGTYRQQQGGGNTDEGEWQTEETYAVHFEGDLSQFGIESPFLAPSSSTGFVKFNEDGRTGRISMTWSGEGDLGGFPFSYVCEVNADFVTGVACDGAKKLRTSCRNGKIRAVTVMTDDSQDGEWIGIEAGNEIGREPRMARINGRRAKVRFPGSAPGQHTVRLITGAEDCLPEQTIDCP